MSIQSTTKGTIGTPTGLIPVKDITIDMRPMPVNNPILISKQFQDSLLAISINLAISWQTFMDALTKALQPAADALGQWWMNLGNPRKKRVSKQTRLFLATIRRDPPFTPHARKQRSMKRARIYDRKQARNCAI